MRKILKATAAILMCILAWSFTNLNTQNDLNQEIIGVWVSQDDLNYKREFILINGVKTCNEYYENQLQDSHEYLISNTCNNENNPDSIYLSIITNLMDKECFEINAINYDNNNIMSIINLQTGKIELYNKQ